MRFLRSVRSARCSCPVALPTTDAIFAALTALTACVCSVPTRADLHVKPPLVLTRGLPRQFYRFRPLAHENFLSDAAEYEALRAYMREGSLIGNTFAGPMLFTDSGSNGGRSASTLQTAGTGVAKLIFPADIARAGLVFPAPGSEQCPFNFYREYTGTDCPLCRHQCLLCRDGSEWIDTEVCGCSKGYWSDVIVVGQGCEECPGGNVPRKCVVAGV